MNPFASTTRESAASLGEVALINRIRRWLGTAAPPSPAGPGDDCAILRPRRGAKLLVTTDPIVWGRHFDGATSPSAAAAKLLRRNLSDIAAMGGTPRFAVLSWAIPARTSIIWLAAFHRALAREASRWGVTINGGDISSSERDLSAHMTLIGESRGRTLLRAGAREGDSIYVTGTLGGSILGRHARFEPRIEEGKWLAGQSSIRCMIDVSDGLAKELPLITPKGCRAALDGDRVPVSPAARRLAKRTGRSALEHALTDGEDFELLFAVARDARTSRLEDLWCRRFSTPLSRIGRFVGLDEPASGGLAIEKLSGFEHFLPHRSNRPRR